MPVTATFGFSPMFKHFLLLLAALVTLPASGQFRSIPDDTKRGTMTHLREMHISLDGQPVNLAAGAQIRGTNNLIIVPHQLPQKSLVKYQLDTTGQIIRVWILTPEEAARPDKPKP